MTTTKALSIITLALCCATPALSQQQHQLRLEWSKNVTEYRGQNGRRITHVCPPEGQLIPVTGTDSYTDDSGVCSAAVHAGLITLAAGGVVTIEIGPGRKSYAGSARNGVTSKSFGSWWGSFSFAKGSADGRIDWRTSGVGVELAGRPLTVVCPPGGTTETVWGTDSYTDDSPICVAAVHAGLITFAAGGHVTVEDAGAQQSYAASERNGVQSRSYGGTPTGFRFSGAGGAATASAESAPQSTVTSASALPTPVSASAPTATVAPTTVTSTTAPRQTAIGVAAPTTMTTAVPTGTTTATTTVARAPTTQATGRETVTGANAGPPAVPTGIRAEPLYYRGTVMVHWDSMPGATSYDLLQRLPNGTYAGAAPAGRSYGSERSMGVTMELASVPVSLAVVANYGPGEASVPSAPVSVTVPRWYGRYRVSILGFKVERETSDDPLQTDGKNDEIYVRTAAAEHGPDGELVGGVIERQSLVHGDINLTEWRDQNSPNRRIRAGSASTDGGLRTGDAFPTATPWQRSTASNYLNTFPLLVWEGDLIQGQNSVQVAFNLWESDQHPGQSVPTHSDFSPEAAALERAGPATRRLEPTVAGQVLVGVAAGVVAAPVVVPLLALSAPALVPTVAIGMAAGQVMPRFPVIPKVETPLDKLSDQVGLTAANLAITNAATSAINDLPRTLALAAGNFITDQESFWAMTLNVKDRPLGVFRDAQQNLTAIPNLLTLNFENAESQALAGNGPSGKGSGIYEYRLTDKLTEAGGNGIYVVYVQVQRIQ